MDKKYNCAIDELNHMQSKITSLFEGIIYERDQCKLNLEESNKQAGTLLWKINNLKRQNEMLKVNIEKLKKTFLECLNFFQNLDFSCVNFVKVRDHFIETLQKVVSNIGEEPLQINANGNNGKTENEIDLITKEGILFTENINCFSEEEFQSIKKETQSINEVDLTTKFFSDDHLKINLSEKIVENHCEGMKKLRDHLLLNTANKLNYANDLKANRSFDKSPSLQQRPSTPEKAAYSSTSNRSPVFRDLGYRKQDSLYIEDIDTGLRNCKTSSPKLVNEKFLLDTIDQRSPSKKTTDQTDSSSPNRGLLRTKRIRTTANLNSPKKSPKSQLKKSNSKEAEISLTGIRKFTQTVLNVECFKKRSVESEDDLNCIEKENLMISEEEITANEAKFLDDEDDVIMESPKNSQETIETFRNNNKNILKKQKLCAPTVLPGTDLDETYVSSSVVRKYRLNEECESSKELDSIPFLHKREAVRKRTERMKLPGQVCLECDKYYNNVFGADLKSEDFKKVLNKCSRHRDVIPFNVDDTPPGFWKPYLTASTITSPHKND